MIVITKSKKLSRNRKRRIERRIKIDDTMKYLLEKTKFIKKEKLC